MNPHTTDFLQRLEQTDWFCNCGRPFEPNDEVVAVDTWADALEILATEESDDARMEGRNELTVLVASQQGGLTQWNIRTGELQPLVGRLIREKLAGAAVKARIPGNASKEFQEVLEWDLLALCMAHEYNDVTCSRYHRLLLESYLGGRFPCGWVGEVPDEMAGAFEVGKLAVL
ncbi:hypothetical protein [Rhizobacter sp. Root1221]|uniref:hypothetical protein n=1 Tax=Rhizobacter sp. Root1221 TaxID=1736433 RepID=UPI000A741E08|nr:hypothetical protein [Rhizobacter sp. Root1221]